MRLGIILSLFALFFVISVPSVYGEEYAKGGFMVTMFGDTFDFTTSDYQEKSPDIKFENNEPYVIHRYSSTATIGDLFESLGQEFDDTCYFWNDGRIFCSYDDFSWKFFINGKQVSSIKDYVFEHGDRILLTYYATNDSKLSNYKINQDLEGLKRVQIYDKPDFISYGSSIGNYYSELIIKSDTSWNVEITDGNNAISSYDGRNDSEMHISCGELNFIFINIQNQKDNGFVKIQLKQDGIILNQATTTTKHGSASIQAECLSKEDSGGGGCLIATATYGSELAPQVQMLREIRDNQLMNTESGTTFMSGFNELYYTFSPTIADMERESPVFKEIVKAGLTPMLSTLRIMESAETESEVLGLGLAVLTLNLGMYLGLPVIVIVGMIKRF